VLIGCLCCLGCLFTSCSEDADVTEEFDNWEEKNDEAFMRVYNNASASTTAQWKVVRAYTKPDSYDGIVNPYDCIVVNVLETGIGSISPCLNDTVSIHYQGRLIPSESYSQGYVFDGSYDGEYNVATSHPYDFATPGDFSVGFATALQHMHIGDCWRVYIPYTLAYGESGNTVIPGYSMLIFDLRLQDFWR
jgi:FKBP-type peptidyl-prolyl cis-trans isomerase FklB